MTWGWHATFEGEIPKPKEWDPVTGKLKVKKTTKKKVEE